MSESVTKSQYLDSSGLQTFYNILDQVWWERKWSEYVNSIPSSGISKFEWVDGTSAGPTAKITLSNDSVINVDAIPYACKNDNINRSGIILNCDQKIDGTKDFFGLKENGVALQDKYQAKGDYLTGDKSITDDELENMFQNL